MWAKAISGGTNPFIKLLVESLRANDMAGVTVYRGILGYGANRRVRKDAPLGLSQDSPIMLSIVDTEEKLRKFLPILNNMVTQGLVVLFVNLINTSMTTRGR